MSYLHIENLYDRYDKGEKLNGDDALLLICNMAEGTTHGNYEDGIIYSRISFDGNIEIQKKG